MKFGLSLSGLLQHSGDGDMVQRFADVQHLVRVGRELGSITSTRGSITSRIPSRCCNLSSRWLG